MPLQSFASRPTWLMLGTVLSWIPVAVYLHENVGSSMYISGQSMYPFLNTDYHSSLERDVVWVSKWRPAKDLRRGHIVAFWSPMDPEKMSVKRIIATEGDEVRTRQPYPFHTEVVPVGHVWVEGENPDGTKTLDSNTYGPVSKSLIVGKVTAIMYPFSKIGLIKWQDYKVPSRVAMDRVQIISRHPRDT